MTRSIVAMGFEKNKKTKGRIAKKDEKALLNRLKKYKENHLLFLHDFQVHYSNDMSEKDLIIAKTDKKWQVDFEQTPAEKCIVTL